MFEKRFEEVKFHDPFSNFSLKETGVEVRVDPITGHRSRVLDIEFKPPEFDVEELVKGTEKNCPFCPDKVKESTPLFPKDFAEEGRLELNGLYCFPNIVSYSKYSSVVVATPYHFKKAHEIESGVLKDAFSLALLYLERVVSYSEAVRFFSINWNFLYPAGASMAHPHLQTMADEFPSKGFKRVMERAFGYYMDGKDLFREYVEREVSSGERFLGEKDGVYAFSSFAPFGALPDIVFVFKEASTYKHFQERLEAFVELFKKITESLYELYNVFSFNLAIYLCKEALPFYTTYARLVPRIYPRPVLNSDVNFVKMMQDEGWVLVAPEGFSRSLQGRLAMITVKKTQ